MHLWAFLIIVAQSRKFQKIVGASALVINEASDEPMGNLVMLNRHTGLKIYLVPHGMNQTKSENLLPYSQKTSGFAKKAPNCEFYSILQKNLIYIQLTLVRHLRAFTDGSSSGGGLLELEGFVVDCADKPSVSRTIETVNSLRR